MRIHGIHAQGVRMPRGRNRLLLDPGYNVIFGAEAGAGMGLAALVQAVLYPDQEIGSYELWRDGSSELPARAALALVFPPDAYRVIVDFDRERLVLGRFDRDSRSYRRLSTDPREVARLLRAAGLPSRAELRTLYLCPGSAPVAAQAPGAGVRSPGSGEGDGEPRAGAGEPRAGGEEPRAGGEEPRAGGEEPRAGGEEPRAGGGEPRAGGEEDVRAVAPPPGREERTHPAAPEAERLVALEADREKLLEELERRSVLGEAIDEVGPGLDRVRQLEGDRARERVEIEKSRRELLDQRSELRGVPARQAFPLWIGVVLLALGWLAGTLAHALFYLCAAGGAVSAAAALVVSRTARRRMGSIEACLAALRVRERTIEREFEAASLPVRGLLQALELGTLEELAREVADYRGLRARLGAVEEEIAELGERRPEAEATPERGPMAGAPEAPAVPGPEPRAPAPDEDLQAMLLAASLLSGLEAGEVERRFARVVPLHLRLLSTGAFVKTRRHEAEGWLLWGERRGEVIPYSSLPEPQRSAVQLAFRLAVLEAIAPEVSLPLLLGPALPLESEGQKLALARALRRIGGAIQVLHLACEKGDWADLAGRSLVLTS